MVTVSRDGLEHEVPIDAEGRFRFPGLAPGPWTISAVWSSEEGGDVEVEVVAEAGREDVVLAAR